MISRREIRPCCWPATKALYATTLDLANFASLIHAMLNDIYDYVRRHSNRRSIGVLVVMLAAGLAVLYLRTLRFGPSPDGQCYVDATFVQNYFCDAHGARPHVWWIYAVSEATVDMVVPVAYATLMGTAIVWLYEKKTALGLLMLPLLAFIGDVSENIVMIYVALTFDCPPHPPSIPWLATILTPAKWLLIAVSSTLILFGLIRWLVTKKFQRQT